MKQKIHNLLSALLLVVAMAFGLTAQATVTQPMTFEGRTVTNGNQSQHAWLINGFLGTASSPSGLTGTSQTFNNAQVISVGSNSVTINGTLNFAEANTWVDVTTGSEVTLVFESSHYWFYGATVTTLNDVNVTGCSSSISSDRHTITVLIPSGKTFGKVYLDCVNHEPMTNSNTTVTVPQGDYWVSDADHKPEPEPTVVYGNTTLVKDIDYTLSWRDNSSAGTGKARVTGIGNYHGTVDGAFPIRWATYTVHFNKNHNDATGSMADQAFTYHTAQNLTANAFSCTSYDFAGWSITPNGDVVYTDQQSVNNLSAIDGETVTLYAKWTPTNYSITYDLDGGSATNPTTYNIETSTFTLNNPTRTGYTFAGWTGTDLTEATQTVTIVQGSTGDRSYTAHWTPITYTVHFNANKGEGSMDDMSFTFDVAQNLTVNTFIREDCTFSGWNTHANGSGTSYTDGQTVSNLTATPNGVVNLYAQWSLNSWQGSGTPNDPYIIRSIAGLDLLATEVNSGSSFSGVFFSQTANIVYDGTENNYRPIGTFNNSLYFSGTYNGNGFTISGINININSTNDIDYMCIGIFGNIDNANIQNVILTNSTLSGHSLIGGIVGLSNGTSNIINCRVESSVTIGTNKQYGTYHGGIAGLNQSGTISGCFSAAIVTNSNKPSCTMYGGIVGESTGVVKDCLYTGSSVTASSNYGSIAGDSSLGIITNNYYTADGPGGSNGSDCDGARRARTLTLGENIALVGDETAYEHSGLTAIGTGNYALRHGSTIYSGATQNVTLSYTGSVPEGYMVTYSYNDGTDHAVAGNSFTMPAADVTVSASVVPDFATWWHADADHDGTTEERAYIISTTTGLNLLASEVNGGNSFSGTFFKLGADIEYDPANLVNGENYTAIGGHFNSIDYAFSGTFDGDGRKVSGIRIHREGVAASTARNQGLFGMASDATIKNVILSDAQIYACSHVGGIVGNLIANNTIEHCLVLNSQITATGNSTPYCGVITGNYTNDVTLTGNYYYNCSLTRDNNTYTNDIGTGSYPVTDRDGARSVHTIKLPAHVTASSAASVTFNDVTYFVPNETVTLTPEPGVTLSEVTVNAVPATDNGDGTWSFTMPAADATVSATISGISTLQGDGSSANPYYIMDLLDWEVFTNWLNTPGAASYYSDKHYRLGADISVTTWAAINSDHPFCGTFDGNGHAIHVTFEQTEDKGVALFHYVGNGCDIHDLTVDGTINSNYQFAAGIVSVIIGGDDEHYNAVSINRCRSQVAFNLGVDGDATSGGLVALSQDNVMLTMQDCLFDGGYNSSTATHCSGMVGYQSNNGFTYIENSYVSPNGMNLISNGNNRNFCRCGNSGNYKITNSYHTDPDFGDDQGEYVGASPDPYYVASLLGNWRVSGNQPVPMTVNMMMPNCTLFSGFDAHSCNTPYNNNGNNDENFTKLVDDNRSTKWCVSYTYSTHSGWQPISLDFSDTIPFAPKGYILTTGGDTQEHPDRLPKVWNLYGWNASANSWDLLDRREGSNDALPSLNCIDKLYLLKNYESLTTTYKKYKFEIEEITREDTVWDGVFHDWTPNTDAFVCELSEIRLLGVVSDADIHKLKHCFVNGILPSYDYTGATIPMNYCVTDYYHNLLVEGMHYTKSITRNNSNVNEIIAPGAYTITFNGIAPYTGSKSISFAVIDPTATYSIILAGADHGSVSTTTTSNVAAGTEVLLGINPETTGYMLQSISATTASGNVEVDGGVWYSLNTDQASFTMPAADVTVTPTFAAINDLSVNMPADISDPTEAMSVDIPDNVTTFKVYDDGGPNAPGSANSNGVMSISADLPGSVLEFSGSVDFGRLMIYNSYNFSDPIAVFDADHPTINEVITTGNGASLCYIGNGYDAQKAGLNLTVKVLNAFGDYGVTISNVTGGTVTIGGETTATKKVNDTVSLNVNVNTGYLCTGYTMEPDCRPVTGGVWHESPTEAYFVMPAENITITPNFTSTLTAAGGLYINMPALNKCQAKTVDIPSGVSSFKVYDDGGASGNYSRYSDGVLVLTAPVGYHLKLSGTVTCHNEGIAPDYLKVFDGDAITTAPMGNPDGMGSSTGQNIGTLTSSDRSLTLYFHSGDHAMAGLNLLVEVTDEFEDSYTITLDNTNVPDGCGIVIPSSGSVGQTITANVTCDANHLLNVFTVTDANGNQVALSNGLCWHNGNNSTATFTMLPRNLIVNYEFVEKGHQYIKIPKSDTLVVTVPEGITTFKIYDDGGPDANYSNGCDGYLLLTAPDGKAWQLTGTVTSEHGSDFMSPYNGSTSTKLIDGCSYGNATGENIGALVTSDYQLLLRFRSDYATTGTGVDLTATIVDPITRVVEGYANVPAGQDRWAFISTPMKHYVLPRNVQNLFPMNFEGEPDITSSHYDLYRFNQSAALEWQNYKAHTGAFVLEPCSGYLYARLYATTIAFHGSVNTDTSMEVALDYVAGSGWNLVGNPLMAPAYPNRPYYTINEIGNDIEPVDNYSGWPIQICTGILVKAEGEGESVTFSKTPQQQSSSQGGLHVILTTHEATRDGSGSTTIQDKAIVSFNEGVELDKYYFGTRDANIYIPQNGKEYAIVSSDGVGEMPLNFKAHVNGEYTLTVTIDNNVIASEAKQSIHLIDNLAGVDVDLLQTPSYTFTAKTTDYPSRFKLVFANENEDEDFAFVSNGEIIVNGTGIVQVIDVLGHQLVSRQVTSDFRLPTSDFTSGLYVLRLINRENIKTQKVVIK